jgi:hypothetical protein
MLSCLVVSYTQRPSGFKAIIKSIFKTKLPYQNIAKMLVKMKYICKKFINHQIVIKSRNICYFAVVMQSL